MSTRPLTFSQRHGYAPMPDPVQLEKLDDRTRTDVWNVLDAWLFEGNSYPYQPAEIWCYHYGYRSDTFENLRLKSAMEQTVFKGEWHEVYSLLEFLASLTPEHERTRIDVLNAVLGYNRAGYRIVGDEVVPITDDTELQEIRSTLAQPAKSPARQHIERALKLFADREHPQYANSIKESISAVEAAARELSGKPSATLGDALDEIAKQGNNVPIHPALLKGWKAIYGFTSDASGIRHADSPDSVQATQAQAQYFRLFNFKRAVVISPS